MRAIEAEGLTKTYRDVAALRDVSFVVEPGEVIGLLGPNGAGKTTLMKVLAGYLQPDAGEARVCGHDVVEDPLPVQRRIGYLPENAPLYGEMTVQEHLLMIAALRGVADRDLVRRLSAAVHATGLAAHLSRPIAALSKGFRQRVGVAQAILHRPELLILDEPTSGLDPTQIAEVRALIRELSSETTILLSTHILGEVELTCERVLVLIGGRLCADARLAELRVASAAVVTLAGDGAPPTEAAVVEALGRLPGAGGARALAAGGDAPADAPPRAFRVESADPRALCPLIYDLARAQGWRLAELRPDTRSLESVFRELADRAGAPTAETAAADPPAAAREARP